MTDPWLISPAERSKHEEQFRTLGPNGGFITGEQAKGFFLQSRLQPQILGVIWMLSDIDGDGKMNVAEFSIACKLINLKLRGFNLPQTLPPALKQSAIAGGMPAAPSAQPPLQTVVQAAPVAPVAGMGVMAPRQPLAQPMMAGAPVQAMPQAPPTMMPTGAPIGTVPPMTQMVNQSAVPPAQMAAHPALGGIAPSVAAAPLATAPPIAGAVPEAAPAVPTQRTSSQDSGVQTPGEWAVPQANKLKYTQVFNMSDRTKSGYLSAVQSRNILIQSQLPQQALAQIWALSDVDNDGRLSTEEFVLAMYLCEQAKAGQKIPAVLPPELIPPSLRRSRTSSIHSAGSGGTPADPSQVTLAQMTDSSFEDKRRENYEKGQAELDRRRKALLDAQRREAEERLRREREEETKREKARLEAERKKQEELERELQRQREIKTQKELERKRQEEFKEQARKDAERQRQQEWEKQRLQELMNVRQRQQENLLALKAKNQSLGIDLSSKEDKIKELTQNISATRVGVTEVKATIDNMRSTRDNYMSDMNNLKAQARDQNQRLLTLNQEKAHLKARSLATAAASGAETAAVEASVTSKQMVIKQLQEKVEELNLTLNSKEEDVNNNVTEFSSLKDQLGLTADRCKDLYEEFSTKRKEVLALREKLLNPDAAWGDDGGSPWPGNRAWIAPAGRAACTTTSSSPLSSASASLSASSSLVSATTTTTITTSPLVGHEQQRQNQQSQQPPARPPPPSGGGGMPSLEKAVPPASSHNGLEEDWPLNPPGQGLPTSSSTNISSNSPWDAFANSSDITNTFSISTASSFRDEEKTQNEEPSAPVAVEGTPKKFKALYQFDARSGDELSFNPGDVIVVQPSVNGEPGWQSGLLNGQVGWFPEAYCELVEGDVPLTNAFEQTAMPTEVSFTSELRVIGEAVALFQWKALQNNHLSFNKNERITIREKQDQWWFGELRGIGGWFPGPYVKMVSGPGTTITPVTTPQELPEMPPMPEELNHNDISQYYLAVYPYQSDEPGDLLFEAGETILVIKKEGDWWHGIIGDRTGIFPSNYVQICPKQFVTSEENGMEVHAEQQIQEQVSAAAPSSTAVATAAEVKAEAEPPSKPVAEQEAAPSEDENDATNKMGKGKKPEICQVIAPYDATSSNQLSLLRGMLVMVRKKTATGWWEGEVQAKGKKRQIGWFPASYVKVMGGSSRTTPVSMELTGKEDTPPTETPPGGGIVLNQIKFPKQNEAPAKQDSPPQEKEKVRALYPYEANNDDELTFGPGDIITVLDKEDSAWWKGFLRGATGVFPSNYVEPFSGGQNSAPTQAAVISPEGEIDSLCWQPNLSPDGYQEVTSNSTKINRHSSYECFRSPEERKRQNVIEEIISTEASYLSDLEMVKKAFIQPMKNSGIISQKDIDLIFVNWNELILVSSSFNKALKVRCKNSQSGNIHMISDILCQQISQLTPYIRFCSLQMKGASLLNEKFEEGGQWADVIRQCQESPNIGGHTLTSFLLKPMQRITKYPLLIKKLLSFTPNSHPDHYNTIEALHSAQTLCEQVNEQVSQRENTDRLEWMQTHVQCDGLQERLVFNSLTNTLGPRKILHIGVLTKTRRKRELVAFLLSDFLLLTTANRNLGSSTSLVALDRFLSNINCVMYRKPMFLSDLKVEAEKDSTTAMIISYPKASDIHVSVQTTHERINWLKQISLAQKHIHDTERSLFNRNQSKERNSNYVGRILVNVIGGHDLCIKNDGNLQSFCEVSLGSQVNKTSVASTPHPKWDSSMQFLVKSVSEDVLCVTVYEKGFFRPNEFLGRTEVRVQTIYEMSMDKPGVQVMRLKLEEVNMGEVFLKMSFRSFS